MSAPDRNNPITPRLTEVFYQSPPVDDFYDASGSANETVTVLFWNEAQSCEFGFEGNTVAEGTVPGSTQEEANENARLQLTCVPSFSFVSYDGTAELRGITEMADVSDPPRKYLQLVPGITSLEASEPVGPTNFGMCGYDRSVYSAGTGLRTWQNKGWAQVQSGAPYSPTTSIPLGGAGDSWENATWASLTGTTWDSISPTWIKTKTKKHFTLAGFTPPNGGSKSGGFGNGFGRSGGNVGSIRGLGIHPTWTGTHWSVQLLPYNFDGTTGASTATERRVYMRAAVGNQDPGTVTVSDTYIGQFEGQFPTTTIVVPPNTSVRFLVQLINSSNLPTAGMDVQVPEQITERYNNGTVEASGLTIDAVDRWVYLAVDSASMPTWEFSEHLCAEDTLDAAMIRGGSVVIGTESIATTISITGGTSAESPSPINYTGRTVIATRSLTGFLVDHIYSVQAVVRTNTIGLTDYVDTAEDGEDFITTAETMDVSFRLRAPLGKEKTIVSIDVTDEGAIPDPSTLDSDTIRWWGRVLANGGTVSQDQLEIMDGLIVQLKAVGLWFKIYLLPFLGDDLAAAMVPIGGYDNTASTPVSLVEADYDPNTGIQGNGTTKYIILPLRPGTVESGSANIGGLFWWELALAGGSPVEPIGAYNNAATRRYCLDLRNTLEAFRWGNPATDTSATAVAAGNHFYHGEERSSTDRELYRNGVSVATDAGAASATGIDDNFIIALGCDEGSSIVPWPGRGGCAGTTNGTLSDALALALYETLRDYLMEPTGRIA